MIKPAFTCAVRYTVTAVCQSPLRTGNENGDTEDVLRGKDGVCFLQGSSLSGAFRDWIEQNVGSELSALLFGSVKQRGTLLISDGRFFDSAEIVLRPRLRIDGRSGTAADGAKYDIAHIGVGASFRFTIHWLGEKDRLSQTAAVERMLSALDDGEIRLGAQKSIGFGRVSLHVTKRLFDLRQAADRESWLNESDDGIALDLTKAKGRSRVCFCLRARAQSLLVKAAAEHDLNGSVTPNIMEAGKPVIPGSSVKGAVRHRAEWIASYLGLAKDVTDELFGCAASEDDSAQAGQLRFEDVTVSQAEARKITRIRINRFTGGVIRGGLFSEEPVSGELTLRVTAPADNEAGCMLLLYALRDLALGLYNLGGGASIGRGFLNAEELTAETADGKRLTLRFREGRCTATDPAGLIPAWRKAMEAKV